MRMKYYDAGEVWVRGRRRQFGTYREITKGIGKGKIEIALPGRKRKVVISAIDIVRYPKHDSRL